MTRRRSVEQQVPLLAHALRSISECVSITDASDIVLFVNHAFLKTYGYDQDEILGRSIVVIRSPKNPPELVAQILPVTLAGGWSGEVWNRRKDGSDFLISLSTSVVRDGRGRPLALIGVARDITEHRRVDEALLVEREHLRQLLNSVADPLIVKDRAHRWVLVNDAFCRLAGQTREALLGKSDYDFFPRREADVFWARDDEVLATGMENVSEETLTGADAVSRHLITKKMRYVDRVGERFVVAIGRDITAQRQAEAEIRRLNAELEERVAARTAELAASVARLETEISDRQRAEAALRASEERQALILRSMPVAVYTATLGTETDASWISDNLLALTGYPAKSFVEVPHFWSERLHPEDRERTVEAFRRSAETGYVSVEYRWLVADGSYRCFLDTAVTRRVGSGGHEVVGTFLDVTERKRMEEQLRHAQKMEAVGRLAGGIAHDFNNLLQAMLSLTQATLLAPDLTALPRRLEELAEHVRRGAQLTRQLLLFSRREKPTPERFDLNELLRESARLLRRLLRENIALQFDLSAQPLPIEADRGQIEQVVMNLAINSSDAMQSGGAITVRTGIEGVAAVFFSVEDTGHGIPDEVRAHLFEPFFTTKEAGHGTGLGLSVVHGIVTEHGGTVEVESRPGSGATFRVVLPRKVSGEHVVVRDRDVAADLPPGRGERVLVVEDEDAARAGLAEILTVLGYQVEAVNSGDAAEALPAEPAFDLLLTDLMLPGKPGGEMALVLCLRWPNLRVIYMSGYTEDEAVRHGAAEGSVRFLQKPFDMATLAHEVRAALDE